MAEPRPVKSDVAGSSPAPAAKSEVLPAEVFEAQMEKVDRVHHWMDRVERCRTANEVMAEFSRDAAAVKVEEMLNGAESADRQRAAEWVLQYSLGKPVDRQLSINMQVTNASDTELEHEIDRLLHELGHKEEEGEASTKFVEAKGGEGTEPSS